MNFPTAKTNRRCTALGCLFELHYHSEVRLSTFSFPNKSLQPTRFNKWCSFAELEPSEVKKRSALCEGHFLPVFVYQNGPNKALKQDAVPTI